MQKRKEKGTCYNIRTPEKKERKKQKKERKKLSKRKKKDHIKGVQKNSPLAHRLERAPYKGTRKVQLPHGLPYAPMVEMVKTPPSQGGSCGFDPRWEYHNASLAELVDVLVSGTSGLCRVGSSPTGRTILIAG